MKRKPPKYVSAFYDRHGKERFRYRKGAVSRSLRGPYNSPEFKSDLADAKANKPAEPRAPIGTVSELVSRYYGSATFQKAGTTRQKVVRGILESFRDDYGNDLVANFRFDHIEAILLVKAKKRQHGKREVGGPVAAGNLHKQLKRLFGSGSV